MSLSALPIALTVPPLSLVPICLAGLLIVRRRPRAGMVLLATGLSGLTLLATPLASGWLIASLERNLPLIPPAGDPPRAIVILSADVVRSAGTPDLAAGSLTLEREQAGAALFRRTGLPILVTGGPAGEDTLGAVMARSLRQDFGVPVRWIEPQARDTWENAQHSAAILKAQRIHSVYLVTHAWHMRRALIAFAATGITITAAPVRLDPVPAGAVDLVPRTSAWLASYYALHEWIGCVDYALSR